MAQSVKHPTLGFGSGCDLTVREFKSYIRLFADGTEPAWDSLSLSLCPSPARAFSLSQNKINLKKGRQGAGAETDNKASWGHGWRD